MLKSVFALSLYDDRELVRTAGLLFFRNPCGFDTLSGGGQGKLFSVLRVRCEENADCVGVEIGSIVLMENHDFVAH